jgi:hypothetical protein
LAILQKVSLYTQERFDVPDARALEAFSQNDWRFFIQGVLSNKSMVLSGFEITNYNNIFTVQGVKLQQNNVVLIHPEATTQAAGFYVSAGTEPDATLVLNPNNTNFVECDLSTSPGTEDTRAFWDPGANSGAGAEYTSSVATVINLNLSISVNVSGFTTGRIPLYKINTNSSGVVTALTDCRPLFFRLGSGGSSADADNKFAWPTLSPDSAHAQLETPIKATSANATNNPAKGGDKNIKTWKQWMDAIMSALLQTKATSYWYQPSLSMSEVYQNSSLTLLVGGTWQHLSGTAGRLELVSGSTIYRLGKTNNCSLSSFPSLDMTANPVLWVMLPQDSAVNFIMGQDAATPVIPQKVGSNVSDITSSTLKVAAGGNYFTAPGNILVRNVSFSYTGYDASTGVFTGVLPDPSGVVKATDYVYQDSNAAVGTYHYGPSAAIPNTANGVSKGAEKTLWLAFFDGAEMHLSNADLVPGEQIQVGNNTSQAIITYIGSTGEADSTPVYNVGSIPNGTNLTQAIKTAFGILETPIYDEVVVDSGGTGWTSGSFIALPPNSRSGNSSAHYTIGTGELVVYENGILLRAGYDYTEASSSSIQLLRDAYTGTYFRFRVANVGGAGASAGGGSAGVTLQQAYANGSTIVVAPGVPVVIDGTSGKYLHVKGDVQIDGLLDPTGIELTPQVTNPLSSGKTGLWVDNTNKQLMYTRHDNTLLPLGNIVESLGGQFQQFTRTMKNLTGATIPAGSAVYISGQGQIGLCNASSSPAFKFFGITAASIPNASTGTVVYLGSIQGIFTGLGIPAGSYIWISEVSGALSTTPATSAGSFEVIVGISDGDDLILQPQVRGDLS